MNKKNIIFITLICVVATMSVAWFVVALGGAQKSVGVIDEITLAPLPSEALALIWVAEHEGFFAKNDLRVNIAPPRSVHEIVSALQAGTVDVGTMGEYAFTRSDFEKNNLLAFGAIDTADTIQLTARKDSGIAQIVDLKQKTIGVELRTGPEFFLASFVSKNNLTESGIKIVDLKSDNAVDAIIKHKVDAVMTFGRTALEIKKNLGDNVVVWPGQSGQPYYAVLVSKSDFIASHKTAIDKLLRSLLEAEEFIQSDPAASQLIVAKRLGYEVTFVNQIWLGHNFELTLQANMLTLMDDEYRWATQNGLTENTEIPKYSNFIHLEALEKIKPDAVSIIRQSATQ